MAVRSRDEIMSQLNSFIGENSSDEALALIEDVSDTYDDFSNRINNSGDWETKYHELDKTWREKYRDRFMNGSAEDDAEFGTPREEPEPTEKLTFEDLFTTK